MVQKVLTVWHEDKIILFEYSPNDLLFRVQVESQTELDEENVLDIIGHISAHTLKMKPGHSGCGWDVIYRYLGPGSGEVYRIEQMTAQDCSELKTQVAQ